MRLLTTDFTPKTRFSIKNWLHAPVSAAPLAVFRMVFGLLMLGSTLRFWAFGWIEDHYLDSKVQFKYFGFEWVALLSPAGMYALHVGMILGALGILLGWYYRWSAALFFVCFTYTELIDLTYYLNHYYFVSWVALMLIFVPAHRLFSVDAWRKPGIYGTETARWSILIFQFLLGTVYVFAGLAKINYPWLIEALPLRIWLPAADAIPVIGSIFAWHYLPWVFSWAGMLYDCTIVGWLSWSRTRVWAYATVVFFHTITGILFQIGVFPVVMIGATLIFFPATFHARVLTMLGKTLPIKLINTVGSPIFEGNQRLRMAILSIFVCFHLCFPWRYLAYPGNLFWTEEGYRFSWRVMLMEKAGTALFYVKDGVTGREGVVDNQAFLCNHQEKQMAMQPDMILQFAHFLKKHYEAQGVQQVKVRAEVYVTLNARPSKLLVDPQLDLTTIQDSWRPKTWILPY